MKKGFTLIELLVVIAIVGVLAAVVLVAINPAKRLAQARDAGRKYDVGQLATALNAYFTTNGSYPTALSTLVTSGDIKQVPTPPAPDTGAAGYNYTVIPAGCAPATASPCTEAALFETLEAPVNTATPVWCFRTAVGSAQEAASCAP